MVEQAIAKYMESVGKLPLGIAFGPVIDAFHPEVPPNVVSATLPIMQMDSMAVMPLQTLLDLVTATVFVKDDTDDDE